MIKNTIIVSFFTLLGFSAYAEEQLEPYPWLDAMHQSIASSVNDSVLWFDDFFALEGFDTTEKARGEARIRLGWEPRSRDFSEVKPRFKLRVKLPNLKNRVDVVLSDYDDESPDDNLLSDVNNNIRERNRVSLALRWQRTPGKGLAHRIGIGRRLQAFTKSTFRNSIPISDKASLRWETSAYLYSRDGLGADFAWQLAYKSTKNAMYRFNNHYYFRDRSNDWRWLHSLQKLTQFSEHNALITGVYFEGTSRPNFRLEEYLVSMRWRKNALRTWLFYEVEPFVLWRRDEHFSASYGVALRVEGYFGKT
ncbi:MAG: hypothetical protein ABJH28_07805 [Paraglaciecola sp.]|uniref:hypothetical protein n=1 Tax=Paraglaciecola sp. TaxID=1920173 RepID=UPI003266C721